MCVCVLPACTQNLAAQKLPRISDSGLVSIAENGSLQRLTLHSTGTGVTDTTLQVRRHTHTHTHTHTRARARARAHTHAQICNLHSCTRQPYLRTACVFLPRCCVMHVCVCVFVFVSLQALMAHCQGCLEYLDISFCRGFSSEALGALADTCTQLQQLVVFGCSQLTDRMAHGHTNSALASGGLVGVGTSVTVAA